MIIDADEVMVPKSTMNLKKFLSDVELKDPNATSVYFHSAYFPKTSEKPR